jgi:enolase
MSKITGVWARQILDSRGIPTVEAACRLDTGEVAVNSVPSGTSVSTHEAVELRDGDNDMFNGLGVTKAVDNVNKVLAPAINGQDPTNQRVIDERLKELDGTQNKSKLGANAILSVSEVITKVAAMSQKKSLHAYIYDLAVDLGIQVSGKIPAPLFNMINGGLHGAGNLDFQEFHLIPASSKKYSDALRIGAEIYRTIGNNLQRKGAIHSVGKEGGYAPNLFTNIGALQVIVESVGESNYQLGRDVFLGLDVAATTFYKNGQYSIRDKSSPLSEDDLLTYYKDLNDQYHLALIEDPFSEDDWGAWSKLAKEIKNDVTVVGDDLLATNPERVQKAISEGACNGILVKPNQIGTVTDTLSIVKMARDAKWEVVVSHRSGETNDYFIADFAVGVGADYCKFGAPARGERVAKYNRLLAIEQELSIGA